MGGRLLWKPLSLHLSPVCLSICVHACVMYCGYLSLERVGHRYCTMCLIDMCIMCAYVLGVYCVCVSWMYNAL